MTLEDVQSLGSVPDSVEWLKSHVSGSASQAAPSLSNLSGIPSGQQDLLESILQRHSNRVTSTSIKLSLSMDAELLLGTNLSQSAPISLIYSLVKTDRKQLFSADTFPACCGFNGFSRW